VILALAGRRIDPANASMARFPPENVPLVERRLDWLFAQEGATALVSSAACGADLIALDVAGRRGVRRRIVLPFARARFRAASVTDRPGDWGGLYDRVLDERERAGDVVILEGDPEGALAYLAAGEAILDNAAALARHAGRAAVAVVAWDAVPRGSGDVTAAFAAGARQRGWRVVEVSTL